MWLLILQVILNFPSLISTIVELWKLIRSLSTTDKAHFEGKFVDVLKKCLDAKALGTADYELFKTLKDEILAKTA